MKWSFSCNYDLFVHSNSAAFCDIQIGNWCSSHSFGIVRSAKEQSLWRLYDDCECELGTIDLDHYSWIQKSPARQWMIGHGIGPSEYILSVSCPRPTRALSVDFLAILNLEIISSPVDQNKVWDGNIPKSSQKVNHSNTHFFETLFLWCNHVMILFPALRHMQWLNWLLNIKGNR